MNKLKSFVSRFFTSLGCKISEDEETLIITDIPEKFEKFAGKKGPYTLCFEVNKEGFELVTQSHHLIRNIKDFLEGRGETALMRLEIDFEPKEDLPKLIKFTNSNIKSYSKTGRNEFFIKFSFSSSFQYLNQRENINTDVFIKDGEIFVPPKGLNLVQGNKRDIGEINIDKEYSLAKEKLKESISQKVKELGEKLNSKLKEEIERIKGHYENNLKEFKEQEEALIKQVGASFDPEKKKRYEKMLENLRAEKNPEAMKAEEIRFTEYEAKKHSLSINNKLLSTAVIYYPIIKVNLIVELENKIQKIIELTYNSLSKSLEPVFCLNCKKEVDEIVLCSSGHIICRGCGERCKSCGSVFCPSCVTRECGQCERKTCPVCTTYCDKCKKPYCPSHLTEVGTRRFCKKCIKTCKNCGSIIDPSSLRIAIHEDLCLNCSKKMTQTALKEMLG